MTGDSHISIWFFVGLLLDVYGVLILGASLYALASPPARQVVLADLHPGLWWGALLIGLGVIYTFHFYPGRQLRKRKEAEDKAARQGE